ncbi:hypothetical protein IW148_003140, partial [Coemansia sp. RSA 1199]
MFKGVGLTTCGEHAYQVFKTLPQTDTNAVMIAWALLNLDIDISDALDVNLHKITVATIGKL